MNTYSLDLVRKAIQKQRLQKIWSALTSMKMDDENHLWISTIVDDQKVYQWWVLDADDGSLLAQFTWPREKQIEVIKNGKLYIRETDHA